MTLSGKGEQGVSPLQFRICYVWRRWTPWMPFSQRLTPSAIISMHWIVQVMKFCVAAIDLTTVFVDTRLSKTKHPRKRFQNFRQSCMLSTDWIEIHQSQPLVWSSDLDNTHDWRKFWKRFRECFLFESRVSTKTVVILLSLLSITRDL